MPKIMWYEIDWKDALELQLPHPNIQGPKNELGQECTWPWDPEVLAYQPIGQYHCPYCGSMQIAGVRHIDYGADPRPILKPGRASWVWDEELGIHIPCCSYFQCGNGPLMESELEVGLCSGHLKMVTS